MVVEMRVLPVGPFVPTVHGAQSSRDEYRGGRWGLMRVGDQFLSTGASPSTVEDQSRGSDAGPTRGRDVDSSPQPRPGRAFL